MTKPSRPSIQRVACLLALIVLTCLFAPVVYAAPGQVTNKVSTNGLNQAMGVNQDTTFIETDVTWTISSSPYLITETTMVLEGATLSVEPGVEVIFDGPYQLFVQGGISAVGTMSDTIKFTASDPLTGWGGIRLDQANTSSRLEYCEFTYGYARGDWPDNTGGALRIDGSIDAVKHCSFLHNTAELWGGAVYVWNGSAIDFSYNVFADNIALDDQEYGHAIYVGNSEELVLNHLTISESRSNTGYCLYVAQGQRVRLQSTILWDSFRLTWENGDINYCNLSPDSIDVAELPAMGNGNIASDPRFVDAENLDFTLRLNSPCIDAGAPSSPYQNEPEPNGGRANMGAFANSPLSTNSMPLLSFDADEQDLDLDPVAFGLQKVDIPGDSIIQIYNVGRQVLEFTDILFDDNQFTCNYEALVDTGTGTILVQPDSILELTITFTPEAVDSVEALMWFETNDPNADDVEVSLSGVGVNPVIEVFPNNFDFGNVAVSLDTVSEVIQITNSGENVGGIESLLILSRFYGSDNFSIVDDVGSVFPRDTLIVGETREYLARFHPVYQGDLIDSVRIASNAGDIHVHMSGSGSQAVAHAEPTSLQFGVVAVGQELTQEFLVWNTGAVDLTLSEFVLSDPTNFSYEVPDTVLASGDTIAISVTFAPTAAGTYNRNLRFETTDPDHEQYTILLYGTGTSQTNWWIGEVGDITWIRGEGDTTYYVVGDISIPTGQTLTIEPSVKVKFEGDFSITVHGTLNAIGTSVDPIDFATINEVDSTWSGIDFQLGSSGSVLEYCTLHRGAFRDSSQYGGVLRVKNSAPTLKHCDFYDNTSYRGGAVGLLSSAEAVFEDCRFYNNTAEFGGAVYGDFFNNSEFYDCSFYDNTANVIGKGGALYLSGCAGSFHHNMVYDNNATGSGGGLFLGDGTSTLLYENEIHDNTANNGGGLALIWNAKPYIHDELIYANTATSNGGGIFIQDGCTPVILNSLIAENNASIGQALFTLSAGSLIEYCTFISTPPEDSTFFFDGWNLKVGASDQSMITNSIIGSLPWASSYDYSAVEASESDLMITYSDVLGVDGGIYPGLENVNIDPEFTGEGSTIQEIYQLEETSDVFDHADGGGPIGYLIDREVTLAWETTLSLLQNPIEESSIHFVLTSTIPLWSAPYMYMLQDLPDTVEYTLVYDAYMNEISPMVYSLPLYQEYPGAPTIVYFYYTNILGETGGWIVEFVANYLSAGGSSLVMPGGVSASGRALNSTGMWALVQDNGNQAKPLETEIVAIGEAYTLVVAGVQLDDGRITFALDSELLGVHSAENCAIARWNGECWEILPSIVNGDQSEIWTPISGGGNYRVVWGEGLNSTVMLPEELTLYQNYPNPFNPVTNIQYALPKSTLVKLDIYNLMGRKVITLLDGRVEAGIHTARWHGLNAQGMPAASGVYLYRLQAGGQLISKKMVLVR